MLNEKYGKSSHFNRSIAIIFINTYVQKAKAKTTNMYAMQT